MSSRRDGGTTATLRIILNMTDFLCPR
jgi:hypothetical protein